MKVRVVLTVDVDEQAWRLAYGEDQTAEDIREGVRSSITVAVPDLFGARSEGIIRDAEEKS